MDSEASSSHYLKPQAGEGLDDKYFTPKKKRELSGFGELSTKMHTPAQPFESVDNSEVIDVRVTNPKPKMLIEERLERKKNASKSEGKLTPIKAIFDEWSVMTEFEVKQNLYLKKLFRVVSSVRVNSLNFGEEVL